MTVAVALSAAVPVVASAAAAPAEAAAVESAIGVTFGVFASAPNLALHVCCVLLQPAAGQRRTANSLYAMKGARHTALTSISTAWSRLAPLLQCVLSDVRIEAAKVTATATYNV